ncbi:hypothetical protein R2325_16540 [Mycobacteroides chelonae]|jgi:hypothetical protein|uniref:hypothetical protein n=1 Tax=Mycobacteroides TaxID=670516 RepID=UPI0009261EEF|nr:MULTISPECIES: hypothetical protein [Mycobacteroides]MBV6360461.1 hypothetical protein [Mycobacteroides chelonae]MEC4857184.1 hypothetical protein [Mycobacteroides chelonae]MEC4873593.1 hypothetical protein [Mycobacteroides chelonae]SHW94069.1 Uncharacterised protein [Mycobacteroides abscessus subsp. abscessus]SKL80061.1 Uncharacterised protein [Mycobacteroides abscessus subsp. abscessus]
MGIEERPAQCHTIKYIALDGTAPVQATYLGPADGDPREVAYLWQVVSTQGIGFVKVHARTEQIRLLVGQLGEYYEKTHPVTPDARRLDSLDCEEGRDGTVWADSDSYTQWLYRFNGGWEYAWQCANSEPRWNTLSEFGLLKSAGPYTEVVE